MIFKKKINFILFFNKNKMKLFYFILFDEIIKCYISKGYFLIFRSICAAQSYIHVI
jgi:hypothetical protein